MKGQSGLRAEVFACEGVELGEEKWLVVRRFDAEEKLREAMSPRPRALHSQPPAPAESVMRNPRDASGDARGHSRTHSVLTREEIDDFFDNSVYGDEVTSKVSDPYKY